MTPEQVNKLKNAMDHLEQSKGIVSEVAQEIRDEYDEMTEKQQESDKGKAFSKNAEELEELDGSFDDLVSGLSEFIPFNP